MTFKSTWSTNICGFDNEYFLNKIWISSNLCALGKLTILVFLLLWTSTNLFYSEHRSAFFSLLAEKLEMNYVC